jgi:hypothetical protein
MKKIVISALMLLAVCLSANENLSGTGSQNTYSCSGTMVVHSLPNLSGKWCSGGQSGTFTTDANGTAVINSLCPGNYSICVIGSSGQIYHADHIFSGNFYDLYVSGGAGDSNCPCGL